MPPPVPSAPVAASAEAVLPAASYLLFILLLASLGCVSSQPCQTQDLQKNVSALLPSLNHVAGLKK